MHQHKERHRTQCDPEPSHESQQVSSKKLVGLQESADRREYSTRRADYQRPLLDDIHHWRCCKVCLVDQRFPAHWSAPSFVEALLKSGNVAPDAGSLSRMAGMCDGICCPAGMSEPVAF